MDAEGGVGLPPPSLGTAEDTIMPLLQHSRLSHRSCCCHLTAVWKWQHEHWGGDISTHIVTASGSGSLFLSLPVGSISLGPALSRASHAPSVFSLGFPPQDLHGDLGPLTGSGSLSQALPATSARETPVLCGVSALLCHWHGVSACDKLASHPGQCRTA